jgi:glycosyltransferase involved in cell wall biosynthesis
MILSILIATLPERANHLAQMRVYLGPLPEGVEIITDDRGRNVPTGTKRNEMIKEAKGKWVVFVDDDDKVELDYVSLILEALAQNPDVVTFQGTYLDACNPTFTRIDWTIKLGEKYEARTQDGKYQIYRWPNHLSVMRKSIASSVKFPDIWQGEDYEWSKIIAERGLLKTEVHIPKQLYHYIYVSKK